MSDKPYDLSALQWAIYVLTSTHTRDDELTGFVFMHGSDARRSGFSETEYLSAWEILRWAGGLSYRSTHNPEKEE